MEDLIVGHGGDERARVDQRVVLGLALLYRGNLIINTPLLGPYSRTLPRVLWWS